MKWWHLALPLGLFSIAFAFWKRRWIMAEVLGTITDSPADLADSAGYDTDLYSLARVGQSEESGLGSICVMFATKTEAKRSKKSVTELVTHATLKDAEGHRYPGPGDGKYGNQGNRSQGFRFCSTASDPSDDMLTKAGQVISGAISDPTNGCHHWDNPSLQDKKHAADPDTHLSSEEIARRREASGWHMVIIDGVTRTRFWR